MVDAKAVAKLRDEISKMFEGDEEVDPAVVERVMQIANDALAAMPEPVKDEPAPDPKQVALDKLNAEIEAMKANTNLSDELKSKLDGIPGAVEAALAEDAPAEPAPAEPAA